MNIKEQLKKIDLEDLTNKKLVELFPDLSMQQRYNLMEAKLNVDMIGTNIYFNNILEEQIKKRTEALPTQTVRSKVKEDLQQFSTPLHLAHFMAQLLDLQPNDIVLDPSAGTGNLLTFVNGKVKEIYANEIDPDRAEILEYLGYKVTNHNAEFINDLLDYSIKPNKIIMNPPFSAGLKVSKNKTEYGFKHLSSALDRLEMNGRLVCMLGESCMNHTAYWTELANKPNIRIGLSCTVDGSEYYKNGTTFGTHIIVISKHQSDPKRSLYILFHPSKYNHI